MPIRMPFLDKRAIFTNDSQVANDWMQHFLPTGLVEENAPQGFGARMVVKSINGSMLSAQSVTEWRFSMTEAAGWTLLLPVANRASIFVGEERFDLSPHDGALLMPHCHHHSIAKQATMAGFTIDPGRLAAIRASQSKHPPVELLGEPIALGGDFWIQARPAMHHLLQLVDVTSATSGLAAWLGVDDMLLRWLVWGLDHQRLARRVHGRDRLRAAQVDLVCDAIRSSYERPLTLTDMENVSGVSGRALQYAFRKRFGMAPLQWQRQERLHTARRLLQSGLVNEHITQIALRTGFATSSTFSDHYRRLFGETPSATRAKARFGT